MNRCTALALLLACLSASLPARDFSPDRPDTTEGPYTVDKGHVQFEIEWASLSEDQRGQPGFRQEDLAFGNFNLKLGVADNVDLEVISTPWRRDRATDLSNDATVEQAGADDLTLRAKFNLWGNDGGPTAFGLIPFVNLPSSAASVGRAVTGGLIFPLNLELPAGFGLGTMLELDAVQDNPGDPCQVDSLVSASLGHSLIKDHLDAFVELASAMGEGASASWRPSFNAGLELPVGENQQWDCGFNQGLAPGAGDWRLFAGYAFKI